VAQDKKVRKAHVKWDDEKVRQLDKYCQLKPSLTDVSELLNVSDDTILRHCRKYNMTFAEYRNKKMAKTRMTLTQKALEMALNGNATMMIFSLKNLCGWADMPDAAPEDTTLEFD